MDLSEIKQFADIPIVNKGNVKESKLTIAIIGEEKSGKTHFWCSFPKPIICLYTDLNEETADGFIRDVPEGDIVLIKPPSTRTDGKRVQDWPFYADKFVPVVQNRMLDCATVVIDSYSFLSQRLVAYKQGNSDSIKIQQWGEILNAHADRMAALCSAARPTEGKPSYHIVVTSHLVDVTDDKGALVKTRPAIAGAFKDEFGKCFGTVLISKAKAEHEVVQMPGGGKEMSVVRANHFCYTIPPTQYMACGDGVGGKGGRAELPGVIENTYQALCKAWGIKEDEL
jgi:hypothetical protein